MGFPHPHWHAHWHRFRCLFLVWIVVVYWEEMDCFWIGWFSQESFITLFNLYTQFYLQIKIHRNSRFIHNIKIKILEIVIFFRKRKIIEIRCLGIQFKDYVIFDSSSLYKNMSLLATFMYVAETVMQHWILCILPWKGWMNCNVFKQLHSLWEKKVSLFKKLCCMFEGFHYYSDYYFIPC